MSAAVKCSVAEYLAFERASPTRHEYCNGVVSAVPGGNEPHSLAVVNIGSELGSALEHRRNLVLAINMRVRCPGGLWTYPDVVVTDFKPQYDDDLRDTLLNPIVIVEVLSPSTERYDRGRKFKNYQTIPSLREYVLVSSDEMRVEHFARQDDADQWLLTTYSDPAAAVRFPVLDVAIPFAEIYAKVEFLPEPPPHEGNGEPS